MASDKVPMLAEGHRQLTDEVKRLKLERPEIIDAIEEARAHGDLSENAEYHAAKERQGQVEAQIADIEDRLSRAMVIDPTTLSGERVVFGATVHLVTAEVDSGAILGQVEVAVLPGDTAETLATRVLIAEHQLYPRILADFVSRPMNAEWIENQVDALARLLPDFATDDADLSGGLRSLHEPELIAAKDAAAAVVLDTLPGAGGRVELTPDQADAWLAALNDVRLALGTALDVSEDMPDDLPPDDPRAGHLGVYHWLTYVQDGLVQSRMAVR